MLRSTRLVVLVLTLALLGSSAPAALAGPTGDFSFGIDLKSRIEAVFSALETVWNGIGFGEAATETPGFEVEVMELGPGYDVNGVDGEDPEEADPDGTDDTSNLGPGYDVNG